MRKTNGNKNTVPAVTTPELSPIEQLLGQFSHMTALERIGFGEKLIETAKGELLSRLTTLETETMNIRQMLGQTSAPSVKSETVKAGSVKDRLIDAIKKNPGKGMTELAKLIDTQFINVPLKSLVESGLVTKNEETKTYTVK